MRIIHSPVGMPGRALNTPLVQSLSRGADASRPGTAPAVSKTCDPAKVPYCITHALIEAVKGNVEEGLFFCGANVGRLDRMYTVRELMDELDGPNGGKTNETCRSVCRSGLPSTPAWAKTFTRASPAFRAGVQRRRP